MAIIKHPGTKAKLGTGREVVYSSQVETFHILKLFSYFMAAIKHIEQRVGVFIDAQNPYHSARNLYKARVNFGAVVKDAVDGRRLVRAVAYVITTEAGDEKNFFEALTKLGI